MQQVLRRMGLALAIIVVLLLLPAPAHAQAAEGETITFFQMFFMPPDVMGIIITWSLIIMSFLVTGLTIHAILEQRTVKLMPEETVAAYEDLLDQKRYPEAIEKSGVDHSVFGRILHASLAEASNGYGAMTRAIEEQTDLIGSERLRTLVKLDVLGAIGPMIGLFGTVYGMIVAFQQIVNVGGQPKPADLAAGVSTALVTTVWGLVVGIPAVAASALVRNKIDGLMVQTMIRVEELISRFKPSRRKAAAK